MIVHVLTIFGTKDRDEDRAVFAELADARATVVATFGTAHKMRGNKVYVDDRLIGEISTSYVHTHVINLNVERR